MNSDYEWLRADALREILAQPPYSPVAEQGKSSRSMFLPDDLGSPAKVSEVRKRHLEEAQASSSPFKKARTAHYGKEPLSQKMISYKKENDITTGRNGALIIFTSPKSKKKRYTIAATEGLPGNPHAELKALDKVPSHVTKVDLIYTERAPCKHGSNCHRKLKFVTSDESEIVHSVQYPADQQKRKMTEKAFREQQEYLGIRAPKR